MKMKKMCIYRLKDCYGDGIDLVDLEIISFNNLNLYRTDNWEYIGTQKFSEKVLRKLDTEKTMNSIGIITLSYME